MCKGLERINWSLERTGEEEGIVGEYYRIDREHLTKWSVLTSFLRHRGKKTQEDSEALWWGMVRECGWKAVFCGPAKIVCLCFRTI